LEEFKGSSAALQSIRFAGGHFIAFLKLTATWAMIASAVTFAYLLVFHPAGSGSSLGTELGAIAQKPHPMLARANLAVFVLGNVSIGIAWIRFALLDETPRLSFRIAIETWSYLWRWIALFILSIVGGAPVFAFLVLARRGDVIPSAFLTFLLIAVAFGIMVAINARLCIALAAAAVGRPVSFRQVWSDTIGTTASLSGGQVLSYLACVIGIAVVWIAALFMARSGMADVAYPAKDVLTNFFGFSAAALSAGYSAVAYNYFFPGIAANDIASTFE
jgi:hypothetical protein